MLGQSQNNFFNEIFRCAQDDAKRAKAEAKAIFSFFIFNFSFLIFNLNERYTIISTN